MCWDWLVIVETDWATPDEDEPTQGNVEQALYVLADCEQQEEEAGCSARRGEAFGSQD